MPDWRFFPAERFTVVECAQCGLGFVNPRPTRAEIQKYYPAAYFQNSPAPDFDRYLKRRFREEASYLAEVGAREGTKRLLDVGCANGDFPRFMREQGWQVEGVEVSSAAERITDFRVYTEEFQNIPVKEETYDAVTAWAVLEHVHDPMAYFQKAAKVLKKGGLFVFLVTNFNSMASRDLFGEDIPRHLYFFTHPTVRKYLQNSSFTLERQDNNSNVYKMAPANWLSHAWKSRWKGEPFRFEDLPMTSREFRKSRGLERGIGSSLQYFRYAPHAAIGRALWPVVEWIQIQRGTYGITTYVARKQ